MVFSSLTFLFFYLPIVILVMKTVPIKFRNFSLFIFSLFFYGFKEPIYIFLMLFSTIFDYFNGYMVYKYRKTKYSKWFVVLSIVGNLGILIFFKYFDFIISSLNLIGINFIKPLGIVLPVGISFYTFQTMSYPIDVYRNQADVQKNLISFGTYVVMFPQLIAGPIVRYKDIALQLDKREESIDKFSNGVDRFMIGLCKKVLLANNIGIVYDEIRLLENGSVLLYWIGIIAFAFQIYFDFSGYSDMAIGLGKMFGFEFLENFNYPYISKSITEFWRRWHISLGTFFKDYVYIPLGGNKNGLISQLINIFIVWLLTGIWHGASYNFILWGLYFGIILMLEKVFILKFLNNIPVIFSRLYFIFTILIGWVIFSIENLSDLVIYLKNMFGLNGNVFVDNIALFYLRNNIFLFIILIIASTPLCKNLYTRYVLGRKVEYLKTVVILFGFLLCVAYLTNSSYNPFLYFRF